MTAIDASPDLDQHPSNPGENENPMVTRLALNVQNALDAYSASETTDITNGIYLISHARKGYIAANEAGDLDLLNEISSWAKPSAPVYIFLRKARKGLFSVDIEAIKETFK